MNYTDQEIASAFLTKIGGTLKALLTDPSIPTDVGLAIVAEMRKQHANGGPIIIQERGIDIHLTKVGDRWEGHARKTERRPVLGTIAPVHGLGGDYFQAHAKLFNLLEKEHPADASRAVEMISDEEMKRFLPDSRVEFVKKVREGDPDYKEAREQNPPAGYQSSTMRAPASAIPRMIMDEGERSGAFAPGPKAMRFGKPAGHGHPGFITEDDATRPDAATDDIVRTFAGPLILSRPSGSVFHRLRQAFHEMQVIIPSLDDSIPLDYSRAFDEDHAIFVIEHDWAAAFANAIDFDGGEINMPAKFCCFEFRVNERRVCACIATTLRETIDAMLIVFIETKVGWAITGVVDFKNGDTPFHVDIGRITPAIKATINRLAPFLWGQVRAVLIAMDANIAATNAVKAPEKLVKSRVKAGRAPPSDYHVISLARRLRAERAEPVGTHKSPRCHFRRGHWNHYSNAEDGAPACEHTWRAVAGLTDAKHAHDRRSYCAQDCGAWRTWVKWTLAGNPDLGWIDKHYRL